MQRGISGDWRDAFGSGGGDGLPQIASSFLPLWKAAERPLSLSSGRTASLTHQSAKSKLRLASLMGPVRDAVMTSPVTVAAQPEDQPVESEGQTS